MKAIYPELRDFFKVYCFYIHFPKLTIYRFGSFDDMQFLIAYILKFLE